MLYGVGKEQAHSPCASFAVSIYPLVWTCTTPAMTGHRPAASSMHICSTFLRSSRSRVKSSPASGLAIMAIPCSRYSSCTVWNSISHQCLRQLSEIVLTEAANKASVAIIIHCVRVIMQEGDYRCEEQPLEFLWINGAAASVGYVVPIGGHGSRLDKEFNEIQVCSISQTLLNVVSERRKVGCRLNMSWSCIPPLFRPSLRVIRLCGDDFQGTSGSALF